MSEYPEAMVGKVADIVAEVIPGRRPGLKQMVSFEVAERVLDALGLREQHEDPLTYKHPNTGEWITSKRFVRYVTEWEDA